MSNKSVKRLYLLDIPEELIRYISRFLMIEDFLHLSMTCKILYHMLPRYAFEHKRIDGPEYWLTPDFGRSDPEESGPFTWTPDFSEILPKGHEVLWNSYFYFDTPPFTSHIFMVTISGCILGDRNLDYAEGNMYLQLIRPHHMTGEPIVIDYFYNILSPQFRFGPVYQESNLHCLRNENEMFVNVFTIEDPIINTIQPGDYFRFIKNEYESVEDFTVHTRGMRYRSEISAQKGHCNALMQDSGERLHIKRESFSNIIEMFKKQDDKEMLKKQDKNTLTVMKQLLLT